MICLSCASPNEDTADFCQKCAAPLSRHATMDPLGTIRSQGYVAHQAVTKPQRFIVVFGVWLWLLPATIGMCLFLAFGLVAFVQDFRKMRFGEIIGFLLGMVVVFILLLCFAAIIYKTTRNYMRLQHQQPHATEPGQRSDAQQRSTAPDATEGETCLACGHPIAPDAVACSQCGWSFEDT
jgi:hypothetical protein